MVCGLGIDTIEIARFRAWDKDMQKIARFFNNAEVAYVHTLLPADRAASLAVRFAAKEAFGKAIGSGLCAIKLVDIAVHHEPSGKPILKLFNSAQRMVENIDMYRFHLSLTHTRVYATACVIMENIVE